jgi:hypothetical protein
VEKKKTGVQCARTHREVPSELVQKISKIMFDKSTKSLYNIKA